jgi:hypothetical protein
MEWGEARETRHSRWSNGAAFVPFTHGLSSTTLWLPFCTTVGKSPRSQNDCLIFISNMYCSRESTYIRLWASQRVQVAGGWRHPEGGEGRGRNTHMKSSLHSSAYVWNPSSYRPRRRVHHPYVFATAFRNVAGPQLSDERT